MDASAAIWAGAFVLANTLLVWMLGRQGKKRSEAIHGQLVPNGGGSLRDAVDRIASKQEEQGEALAKLHTYAHKTRHAQANDIQKLVLADSVMVDRLDKLTASDEVKIQKLDDIASAAAVVASDLAATQAEAKAGVGS